MVERDDLNIEKLLDLCFETKYVYSDYEKHQWLAGLREVWNPSVSREDWYQLIQKKWSLFQHSSVLCWQKDYLVVFQLHYTMHLERLKTLLISEGGK